jgi:glycine betaine/proline transport system ATP-binding protein
MNPANDYVERFVEDVDLSKVLTAAHVMKRPEKILADRGLRVALQIMKDAGISSLYIVDKKQKLVGAITAQDAADALKKNQKIEDIMIRDLQTVTPDTLISDMFEQVATASLPVAVIDEEERLKGIIVRGAILAALAGDDIQLNGNEVK